MFLYFIEDIIELFQILKNMHCQITDPFSDDQVFLIIFH